MNKIIIFLGILLILAQSFETSQRNLGKEESPSE